MSQSSCNAIDTGVRAAAAGRLRRCLQWHRKLFDPNDPRNGSAELRRLQRWQGARLAASFADLLADPNTRPAAEFFLNDLYSDRDFSQRDRDIMRVVPLMLRVLPASLLDTLADAIALGALSHAFDLRVLRALVASGQHECIDDASYAAAYRAAGCARLRRRQIDLIAGIGAALGHAVRKPGVAALLRASRVPARLAGLSELQRFLEAGFVAFARLPDANAFLATIESREREVSRRLFAGEARPFVAQAAAFRG